MEEQNVVSPGGLNKKGVIIGLVIVILLLTVALAYVLVVKKAEAPAVTQVPAAQEPSPVKTELINAETPKQTAAETPLVVDEYAGWSTYRSDRYGYEIKYPAGMKITEAKKSDFGLSPDSKMTFDEAYAKYTGQVCVGFSNKRDSVLISASENAGYKYVICGRTGMGQDTKIKKTTEKITIDGKEYTADVNDMTDSGSRAIETVVELADGTQISFSASNEEYRAGVKKMVESFKKTK